MIGLLDLAGRGLVSAAVDRRGPPLRALEAADGALRALASRDLDALVIEADGDESAVDALLTEARRHGIPALVVARRPGVEAGVAALRAGATDYLHAPFEYEALQDALERLVDACVAGGAHSSARARFITQDPHMLSTLELARSVAASDATVLVQGESGTGKELVARMIHEASPRRRQDMVSVNCAALPAGLLESELFGHERGAFTGAFARSIGKFELADGTTLLLDEIGELELPLQAKLLRVIQEKQVQRVGAQRPLHVDFRLVATTNRDLAAEVARNAFREDLYYRLNVLPVRLLPLRERPGDLPLLIAHFLNDSPGCSAVPVFPAETMEALRSHSWPGNVRELKNLVERLVLTHPGRSVGPHELGLSGQTPTPARRCDPGSSDPPFRTLREMERWLIVHTLKRLEGNRTRTARELGISLRALRNKINEYRIDEPDTLPRSGTARPGRPAPGSA